LIARHARYLHTTATLWEVAVKIVDADKFARCLVYF